MGALIAGPWEGTVAEHRDEQADRYRLWAEHFEDLLREHPGEDPLPVPRDSVEKMAYNYRVYEDNRLAQLDRLRPMEDARRVSELERKLARLEHKAEYADRGWDNYHELRDQLQRERRGTRLDTLGLDAKTRGTLWGRGIACVEDLRKVTAREGWSIKGVGPQRRQEILDALNRAL